MQEAELNRLECRGFVSPDRSKAVPSWHRPRGCSSWVKLFQLNTALSQL